MGAGPFVQYTTEGQESQQSATFERTVTAGENLAAFNAVYLDTTDSGKAKKAINNGTSLQADAFGITQAAILDDATGLVTTKGPITNPAWTWTPGGEVYVDATAGALTQTQPSGGAIAKPMGKATSATTVDVDPDTGWTT
jgi:hypothetical protein